MLPISRLSLVALFISCAAIAVADAAAWPQFRGPASRGLPAEEAPGLPATWSPTENIAWRTQIPGTGWSSPVVFEGRVFITTVVAEGETEEPKKGLYFGGERREPPPIVHHWKVLALDLDSGAVLWERTVHSAEPQATRHIKNSYASETPATDGERLYVLFGNLGLFVFDLDGNPAWEHRIKPRETRLGWGTAASPVLHGDRVFVLNDNDEDSYLLALNKHTGEEVWTVPRDEGTNWATPFIWETDARTEIVVPGTGRVRSYGLDGELLWELDGMSSIAIPTPFTEHGLLYVSSGYIMDRTRPVWAIRPGANGDITLAEGQRSSDAIAWHIPDAGPYNPTPLVYGDYYYTLLDRGFFTCHDARTGEEIYGRQRIAPTGGAEFTASPWAYDGKIFCLSEDGDTYVIKAGPEFEVLGVNPLGEMGMATPAIVGSALILRTANAVYRIEEGA
jgi:outer membrane protein assembly factor BamB